MLRLSLPYLPVLMKQEDLIVSLLIYQLSFHQRLGFYSVLSLCEQSSLSNYHLDESQSQMNNNNNNNKAFILSR